MALARPDFSSGNDGVTRFHFAICAPPCLKHFEVADINIDERMSTVSFPLPN
jgi:hypothetical protein